MGSGFGVHLGTKRQRPGPSSNCIHGTVLPPQLVSDRAWFFSPSRLGIEAFVHVPLEPVTTEGYSKSVKRPYCRKCRSNAMASVMRSRSITTKLNASQRE
jgi:hypothetical protein